MSFWDALGYFLSKGTEFFLDFLSATVYALNAVRAAFSLPFYLVGVVPSIFGTMIMVVVSLGVIKFIFGR